MSIQLNYKDAFAELAQIAEDMENETISVDDLSEKVKRATYLITFCQTKLKSTEEEVRKVLSQMDLKKKSRQAE